MAGAAFFALVPGIINIYRDYADVCVPIRQPECLALEDLHLGGMAKRGLAIYAVATVLLIALPWLVTGWLVFLRKSTTIAEMLMSLGLATGWATDLNSNNIRTHFYNELSASSDLLPLAIGITYLVSFSAQVTVILMAFLIPDGRFIARWSIWLAAVWVIQTAVNTLYRPPLSLLDWPGLAILDDLFTFVAPLAAIFTIWYRFRFDSSDLSRRQLGSILPGAIALVAAYALFSVWTIIIWSGPDTESFTTLRFTSHFIQSGILSALAAWFAVSVASAILRYNLFRTDLVVSRTLVYGILTSAFLALYLLIVLGVGSLVGSGQPFWLSLAASFLIVLLFQPLRDRLKALVHHRLYGARVEPSYEVLTQISERTHGDLDVADLLPSVTRTISRTLQVPFVSIGIETGGLQEASTGVPGIDRKHFPLSNGGEEFGWLDVSLHPGEVLDGTEQKLLETVARQLALFARAFRLSVDLQDSLQRLVEARAEERLRLRRDLHDELGPNLAAQTLIIGAVRRILRSDPMQAEELLDRLENGVEKTLQQVRRIAHSLRPPDLDQLGLPGAIRNKAAEAGRGGLAVDVVFPDDSTRYPAALELAVYHIVAEALTNTVRHAEATACRVDLTVSSTGIELSVADDGIGLRSSHPAGVGLASMRERTEELGGRFTVAPEPRTKRGTVIRAWWPAGLMSQAVPAGRRGTGG